MIRVLACALLFLFVVALPRYVSSPWFDDEYVGELYQRGKAVGTQVRVKLVDSSPITFMDKGQWATFSVSSAIGSDSGIVVTRNCFMRTAFMDGAGAGVIEVAPSGNCPFSSFPIRFQGFSQAVVGLGGGFEAVVERDFRRNPFHLMVEWMKWKSGAFSGVMFNSEGL